MEQVEMWDLIPEMKPPEEKQPDYFTEKELYPGFFEWRRKTHEVMQTVNDRNGNSINWMDAIKITANMGYISPTKRPYVIIRERG